MEKKTESKHTPDCDGAMCYDEKPTHTPTPWYVVGNILRCSISAAPNTEPYELQNEIAPNVTRKEDAEFIVRAVNEYDDLKKQNAALLKYAKALLNDVEKFGLHHPDGKSNWWPITDKLKKAITQAEKLS